MDIQGFLGAEQLADDAWSFELGTELHGAFGGAFGGVIAASAIVAARSVADGREPNAIDCRFLRPLLAGRARVVASVLHGGRSLSNVSLDVFDERDRLAARALVSLVEPSVLKPVVRAGPSLPDGLDDFADAAPWPPVAPIVSTLEARSLGSGDWGFATAVRVPWDDARAAEAACLAGDMCVGQPLMAAMLRERVSTPNPDISLRFCGAAAGDHVVGIGRTERADGGVATLRIGVWSGTEQVAVGVSTALLLPTAAQRGEAPDK